MKRKKERSESDSRRTWLRILREKASKYRIVEMVVDGEIGELEEKGGDIYGLAVCLNELWDKPRSADIYSCGAWEVQRVGAGTFKITHRYLRKKEAEIDGLDR